MYGLLSPDLNLRIVACSGICCLRLRPFTTLPGPIGELANNIVNAITDGVNGLLAQLPTPISPTPFPSRHSRVRTPLVPEASLGSRCHHVVER